MTVKGVLGVIIVIEVLFALTWFTWAASDPPAPSVALLQPATPAAALSRDAIPLGATVPWSQELGDGDRVVLVRIRGVSPDVPANCYLWFESAHGLVVHALPTC